VIFQARLTHRYFANAVYDAGFCHGNSLTIKEVHTFVYLMVSRPHLPWRIYPYPRPENSEALDWRTIEVMGEGDYVWERAGMRHALKVVSVLLPLTRSSGNSFVSFVESPRYWDVVNGGQPVRVSSILVGLG